jgi:hypothetical protein
MSFVRPEVTGCRAGSSSATAKIDHNRGPPLDPANWIELQRIISLQEAARLKGVSIDTLKRHNRQKIIQLSPRRLGMRLCDVLSDPPIAAETAESESRDP